MPRWNLTTMDLDAGIDDNRLLDVQFGEEMEYKQRIQEIQITNSSVTELNFPSGLGWVQYQKPEDMDMEEFQSSYKNSKVYIVGTTHTAEQSILDVRETIEKVMPDVVMVESSKKVLGEWWFLHSKGEAMPMLGGIWGREMVAACEEAVSRGIVLVPGDRDDEITERRRKRNYFDRGTVLRFFLYLVPMIYYPVYWLILGVLYLFGFNVRPLEPAIQFAYWFFAFIGLDGNAEFIERDLYMARVLQEKIHDGSLEKFKKFKEWRKEQSNADSEFSPFVIVAVVGEAHVDGIVHNWETEIDYKALFDPEDLLTVP